LKLKYEETLSRFAFKFNLRRYSVAEEERRRLAEHAEHERRLRLREAAWEDERAELRAGPGRYCPPRHET